MVLGKIRGLAVYFDTLNEHNLPAYSGGDLVSGRVVVEVTGDVRVKSLDITARGMAKVRWTESRNAGANTAYTQNYTEEVEYLHHYDTLIGQDRELVFVRASYLAFSFAPLVHYTPACPLTPLTAWSGQSGQGPDALSQYQRELGFVLRSPPMGG